MNDKQNNKPTVFISYSHKDEKWKERLKPQLKALELAEQLVVWDDRDIDAGENWYPELEEAMKNASVAICMISEHYLSSYFCIKEEVAYLLTRREQEGMALIPILISPCQWEMHEWLSSIQMLPRDGKSVLEYYRDTFSIVFNEVAGEVLKRIKNPQYRRPVQISKWNAPEKIDITRLPYTGAELFGRSDELSKLDAAWDSQETRIINFVAWGGVGKSTLVNKWLERLDKDNFRGAEKVFAWSFYSQGTGEKVTSADQFIREALAFFDDKNPNEGSPWSKGKRLAELIKKQKTLLILDGLEPLQSHYDFDKGKIKDQALAAMMSDLAKENHGLCLISSRETISGLDRYKESVHQINLEKISKEAGRALLRVGGVRGTDEELETVSSDFGNHAFALTLLSKFLYKTPGHDISNAKKIPIQGVLLGSDRVKLLIY